MAEFISQEIAGTLVGLQQSDGHKNPEALGGDKGRRERLHVNHPSLTFVILRARGLKVSCLGLVRYFRWEKYGLDLEMLLRRDQWWGGGGWWCAKDTGTGLPMRQLTKITTPMTFIENLGARHCSKSFTYVTPLNSFNNPIR